MKHWTLALTLYALFGAVLCFAQDGKKASTKAESPSQRLQRYAKEQAALDAASKAVDKRVAGVYDEKAVEQLRKVHDRYKQLERSRMEHYDKRNESARSQRQILEACNAKEQQMAKATEQLARTEKALEQQRERSKKLLEAKKDLEAKAAEKNAAELEQQTRTLTSKLGRMRQAFKVTEQTKSKTRKQLSMLNIELEALQDDLFLFLGKSRRMLVRVNIARMKVLENEREQRAKTLDQEASQAQRKGDKDKAKVLEQRASDNRSEASKLKQEMIELERSTRKKALSDLKKQIEFLFDVVSELQDFQLHGYRRLDMKKRRGEDVTKLTASLKPIEAEIKRTKQRAQRFLEEQRAISRGRQK